MYTREDLKKVHEQYEENFDRLMKSVDTDEHAKYLSIESELEDKGIKIRQDMGKRDMKYRVVGICLLCGADCLTCTGYIKSKSEKLDNGWTRKNYVMGVEGDSPLCYMKRYITKEEV